MSELPPNVQRPSADEIRAMAAKHFIDLSDEEVETFRTAIDRTLETYEQLDTLPEPATKLTYTDRDPGYRPARDEDPLNIFVTKCDVRGADDGPLAGYRVGIKDNVAVAGVEMTCGSKVMAGYVPSTDATVVTRLLDAGARIVGKLNMEDMAYSGSGELSATGAVLNPRNTDYLAGGSSSGSAAAVVNGDVDIAIGGDQGGSIRYPASWCGCVGLKPTYGLVPHLGIAGMDHSIDHVGPLATSVEDCALALDALAGKHPLDHRQPPFDPPAYTEKLTETPDDVTVGLVEEGFGLEESEEGVDRTVRASLDEFEQAGATVRSLSIPYHRHGLALLHAISIEGMTALVRDEGIGRYFDGHYDTQFARWFAQARRTRGDDFPLTLKVVLTVGQYLADEYHSQYYMKAQNLRRELRAAYDGALDEVDVLAMPTTPQTAHSVEEALDAEAILGRALNMMANAAPFNVSHHPAVSLPCGTSEGLPVGLMLVGKRFEDDTLLAAANALERTLDVEFDGD